MNRESTTGVSSAVAHRSLALLLVVVTAGWMDRQVLTILIPAIKEELAVSDAQLGLLAGLGFTLFYTLLGLPVARWADRGVRRDIIVWALSIWSLMTALCGLAANYAQLLLARIGVGAGEAGCVPPAHSMISDFFPPERRAWAFSVYALGTNLGTLIGLVIGGIVSDLLGWRMVFIVVGLPGLLLAWIVRAWVPEPPRSDAGEGSEATQAIPVREVARFMWAQRALRHVFAGAALQSFVLMGIATWVGAFFVRVHSMSRSEAGLALGLIMGLAGAVGTYAAGPLCDRLARRDVRWYMWLPAVGALALPPVVVAFALTPSAALSLVFFAPVMTLSSFYFAPTVSMGQSLVLPRMRAISSASFQFLNNLIGAALGAFAAGLLTDLLTPRLGTDAIRWTMVLVSGASVWAAFHYLYASRFLAGGLSRAAERRSGRLPA